MANKLTKREMVRDIFFLATDRQRTNNNLVSGLTLIDEVASNNYKWFIAQEWQMVNDNATRKDARKAIQRLICSTYNNVPETHRYSIKSAAHQFGFYTI